MPVTSSRFAASSPEWEQGLPFSETWKVALETVEDNQAQDVLLGTRAAWESAYHGKPLVGCHYH